MSNDHQLPPLDGSITVLPGFVDFHAEHNPSRPWVKFPSAEHPGESTSVSFLEFAKATHSIAHTLRPGRTGDDGEIVAVLIHCDNILYLALLAGMVRAGLIPFPMSPRNSPEAVVNMLEKTNCHRIITSPLVAPVTSAVQTLLAAKNYDLKVIELPSLRSTFPSLFSKDGEVLLEVALYPPTKKTPNPDDVVLILHSSGSTGFPKPIPQTQKTVLQWCATPVISDLRGMGVGTGGAMLPTFHTMGIYVQFYQPLTTGGFVGLYTPQEPAPPVVPTPQNLLNVMKVTGCSEAGVVPAFIEAWAQSPETIEYLASLKVLTYAGGPLSEVNGKKLAAAGVRLVSIYGGTEFGAPTGLFDMDDSQGLDADVKTTADWAWFSFGDIVNCRWIDQGDGTYELHFLTCETHQPAIENLPDVKGYATSDLFEPHPKKKGLWRIVGRKDDVIVLGTGEKVVPIPQEGHIGSVPFVAGAVMFGRGKNEVGILIETKPEHAIDPNDESALVEFRNKIWPYVAEANKIGPTFARIFKEMVIVTDPAKPMARASKGTVQRKAVLAAYSDEIDKLYETIEKSRDAQGISPPDAWTVSSVEEWLTQHAASINDQSSPKLDGDLFEQGFDSLSATFLRNRIIGALNSSSEPSAQKAAASIPQEFIFTHPTIQRLAAAIVSLVDPSFGTTAHGRASIEDLIAKYSANLPAARSVPHGTPPSEIVVVLTGSTGGLGAHLLASLLEEPNVAKVYTLNRGNDLVERQKASFVDRGLPVELLSSGKLVQLTADLSLDDIGLDSDVLKEIKCSATHIIHNAWKVDFNLSLSSFESYIANTRKFVDLSTQFTKNVRFLFTSSIAVATGWDVSKGAVPEDVLDHQEVLSKIGRGYESSKYVVEHILAKVKRSGVLDATTLRVGQISGSTKTGAWNTTEWVPSIIKSSVTLGCLPALEGVVSWVPMDVTARTIRVQHCGKCGISRWRGFTGGAFRHLVGEGRGVKRKCNF
ncbi:unnamed protein product [Somion occarium]|uniref:Polyketide synthase-like phosphopantetheine-binding domain-containing protein n=1 Tax=Somion occarium TaxID=3059160 RepID=A0ABP1D8U9_9APHY